jgi:recombination associated protein RdgC
LALTWDGRLSAVIDSDLSIKRIKPTDQTQDDSGDREAESQAERFDADFALMSGEIGRFLPRLLAWFDS